MVRPCAGFAAAQIMLLIHVERGWCVLLLSKKARVFFVTGADASSEGVQRDLLPIIEGSQVSTKYGNVSTDYILFICSGAFHQCKPSDMLAELQGRLPIRVELKGLTCAPSMHLASHLGLLF